MLLSFTDGYHIAKLSLIVVHNDLHIFIQYKHICPFFLQMMIYFTFLIIWLVMALLPLLVHFRNPILILLSTVWLQAQKCLNKFVVSGIFLNYTLNLHLIISLGL